MCCIIWERTRKRINTISKFYCWFWIHKNHSPFTEISCLLIFYDLNYSGIYLYQDIVNNIETGNIYESKLYEGYNCEWRDVLEGWLFESPYFEELKKHIGQINFADGNTYCVALYGKGLVGKGCLLKQAGAWLSRQGYIVLEFKGKSLDYNELFEFLKNDTRDRYVPVSILFTIS